MTDQTIPPHVEPSRLLKPSPPPAPSTNGARDREFLEGLARMMAHAIQRNPHDHTAHIVAREIAEHLELYPLRGPLT